MSQGNACVSLLEILMFVNMSRVGEIRIETVNQT